MSKFWITTLFITTAALLIGCDKDSTEEGGLADTPTSTNQPFEVVSTSPAVGDTNIPVDQNIVISFNKSVVGSENDLSINVANNTGAISGTSTYGGNNLTFNPSNDFNYAANYTVTLTINNNLSNAAAASATESVQTFSFSTEARPTPNPTPAPGTFNLENQTIFTNQDLNRTIVLGPLTTGGQTISYSFSGSSNVTQGARGNQIIYNGSVLGTETINVTATFGSSTSSAVITVNVNPPASSNYITDRRTITPDYGASVPEKGESRVDPVTGITITRLTDASELSGTNDAFIVYSRYSPENSTGRYFLAFGGNSTSSWVIDRVTGNVITALRHQQSTSIGENHEVRWDLSGNHPNRVYYRNNMGFYMIDDVTNPTTTLLKDFSSAFPASTKIYNDVEGDSSNDSDHWAFMAAHYNGSTYVVDGYIHYQISTNTTHTLKTSDLTGTNLIADLLRSTFSYRPNMVEMSPDGQWFIMHHGRKWDDSSYGGSGADWIDTWFDGAWAWPADFDFISTPPRKISVGETHSGWAFDAQGREFFVSQNNRTDKLDAIATTGSLYNYANRLIVGSHQDFGWVNGFHYGKMPESRPGWIFINTYANRNSASYASSWAADQLIMIKLDAENNNPTVWRIGSNYNRYDGNYRDEAPAAINQIGNRIYLSNNWGGQLGHREVFVYELPDDWNSVLN